MALTSWTDDPLSGANNDYGIYIRELQQNCNEVRSVASLGLATWLNASAGEKCKEVHLNEIKTQLEDPLLLRYYGYNAIKDILGEPFPDHPTNVNDKQKMIGFSIINAMRDVIDAMSKFLYIIDDGNGRVVQTDMNGSIWNAVGSSGSGVNQFLSAEGIWFDPASRFIFVADSGNNRIVRFKISNGVITEWDSFGTGGSGATQFSTPRALHYDSASGYFHIADYGNHRIVKTQWNNVNRTNYGSFGGSGVGKFTQPQGIWYDAPSTFIFITDAVDRIIKTKINGDGWTTFGSSGSGANQFNTPKGIVYDNTVATGNIYVADTLNDRIVQTDMNGTVWVPLGTIGTGDSQFDTPDSISYNPTSALIYITDNQNDRVIETKINGDNWKPFGTFGTGDDQFSGPTGVIYG